MTASPSSTRRKLVVVIREPVKWIVKGQTLMIEHRVFNIAKDCQIVFSPKQRFAFQRDDRVESVEFWFRYPIVQGILYVLDPQTLLLKPATENTNLAKIPNSHKQWLIRYTGATARAIHSLFREL